jgi:hypothetical protein
MLMSDAHVPQQLPAAVTEVLDDILQHGGRSQFLAAGEKGLAVRRLRELVAAGHRPAPEVVEAYLATSGQTPSAGVKRLGGWYRAALEGRRLRYQGRAV